METKDCLGQICLLKPDFLKKVYKEDKSALLKEKRPYLIAELKYNNAPQLFAIPFQTSIKPSLPKAFWDKMPRRLETMSNMEYGILYSSMIPIKAEAILRKKEAEKEITHDDNKGEIIFRNFVVRAPDALPAEARQSFEYIKKRVMREGMSCFKDFAVNKAYAKISKTLHSALIKYKDEKLKNILENAQNYLTNHYEAVIRNNQNPEKRVFVDMPAHYTKISALLGLLKNTV